MFHFLAARGELFQRAAVHDVNLLRAKAQRRARGIHRNVAAADDRNAAALHDGGHGVAFICLHQVASGEELICGIHALVGFAGDAHEVRQTRARAHEHGFIALLEQLVDGERLADDDVRLHIHAHRGKGVDLFLHDGLGQTELRNAVNKHAARRVERLEHGYFIALLCKVARAGQPGRAGAHNCDAVAV